MEQPGDRHELRSHPRDGGGLLASPHPHDRRMRVGRRPPNVHRERCRWQRRDRFARHALDACDVPAMMRARSAFTLVELLFVMGIFTVISGALLASFVIGKHSYLSADTFVHV